MELCMLNLVKININAAQRVLLPNGFTLVSATCLRAPSLEACGSDAFAKNPKGSNVYSKAHDRCDPVRGHINRIVPSL